MFVQCFMFAVLPTLGQNGGMPSLLRSQDQKWHKYPPARQLTSMASHVATVACENTLQSGENDYLTADNVDRAACLNCRDRSRFVEQSAKVREMWVTFAQANVCTKQVQYQLILAHKIEFQTGQTPGQTGIACRVWFLFFRNINYMLS